MSGAAPRSAGDARPGRSPGPARARGPSLAASACASCGASLGAGGVTLLDALLRAGLGRGRGAPSSSQVRLPRVLLAAVLGGALTVAGIVFQALLRNPLADPYVLGVSGGASVGAVVALLAGLGGASAPAGRPRRAGSSPSPAPSAPLLLIERVATVDGRLNVYTILLTGAVFNAFSAALIFFLQSIASFEELHAIVFQLMGQIPAFGYARVGAAAPPPRRRPRSPCSPWRATTTPSPWARRPRPSSGSTSSGSSGARSSSARC